MDYKEMTLVELRELAREKGIGSITRYKKAELIDVLEKVAPTSLPKEENNNKNSDYLKELDSGVVGEGILEVLTEGYGFMRVENYLPGTKDIYVSPSQIRRFNLRTGDKLVGRLRKPKENEKFPAMLFLTHVNGEPTQSVAKRPNFEDLTPIFPTERLKLETSKNELSTRIIDIMAPIGKGQRGMIVAPPKAGKTVLLKKVANAITHNHPDVFVIVLLIDERPEEVTDMQRSIQGNVDVIYSTFDEQPEHHKRVAEMVLERAKRLVEQKKDVVVLLDSITRLSRAYNLTVLATALVETGSKMDDVIFEEFKGTGNMELVLDRKMSEKRIFPAVNMAKSGTRREELLLSKDELDAVYFLRKSFSGSMTNQEVTEQVMDLLVKTDNNEDFVKAILKLSNNK